MPTIRDVAAAANVSIATVSNYINKTRPVSPAAAQRIKQAIEQLGYTQNLFARSLKSNVYNDVGVILPNLSDPYYAQVFQGIEQAFQNGKHFINLALSYDIPDIERNIVDNLTRKNVCGLILATCIPDDWRFYYDRFTSRDRALVLIDRMIENLDSNFVAFDNRRTTASLVCSLLAMGKRRIHLFTGPSSFYCESECVAGYTEAVREAGLGPGAGSISTGVLNKEKAFQQTIQLFKTAQPDAIIATSELTTMGVIEALTLLGFGREEVPVFTLGEEHWNRYTHSFASVSTVRPAIQMGVTAANLLKKQILSPKTHEKTTVILNDRAPALTVQNLSQITTPQRKTPSRGINILFLETPQSWAIQGFLPNFENASGIKANAEILPQRYLFDRILSEASSAAEKQSDVYMFDIPWLYDLASRGILADITDFIRGASFDASVFLPGCLKYFSEFEGRYFGLPFMYAPQILYYRKDLFENRAIAAEYARRFNSSLVPPRTWKEFAAVAEFFTSCDLSENRVRYGTSIPAAYKECFAPEIYMRLFASGGRVFDSRFNVVFNSPQTLKAYVNFKSTFKFAKPDYRTATDISVVSDFVNGETAMLITYPSFLTNTTDLRTGSMVGDIGYSLIPGRTPILGGWSFGINSRSEKKEDALKFLQWTVTEENANYFTLLGGQPAVNSLFANDELITLYPWLPLYHMAYQYTKPVIPPYKSGRQIISQDRIDAILYAHAMDLIDDKTDVATAISRTHADLAELFKSCGY
jgi:multiple sugar transport system substrate-binding protein